MAIIINGQPLLAEAASATVTITNTTNGTYTLSNGMKINYDSKIGQWKVVPEEKEEPVRDYTKEGVAYEYAQVNGDTDGSNPLQNKDGVPHLAYYNREYALSFTWSGREGELIDVAQGGYGEDPFTHITPNPVNYTLVHAPADLLDWFKEICELWITNHLRSSDE